jgi:hypothetical protein
VATLICVLCGLPKDDRVASSRFLRSTAQRCWNSKKIFVFCRLEPQMYRAIIVGCSSNNEMWCWLTSDYYRNKNNELLKTAAQPVVLAESVNNWHFIDDSHVAFLEPKFLEPKFSRSWGGDIKHRLYRYSVTTATYINRLYRVIPKTSTNTWVFWQLKGKLHLIRK